MSADARAAGNDEGDDEDDYDVDDEDDHRGIYNIIILLFCNDIFAYPF